MAQYRGGVFVQRVEIAVRDGQEAAFEAALCEVRQQVFMTRGFRDFTVAQGVEEPARYTVQVLWETADELLSSPGPGASSAAGPPSSRSSSGRCGSTTSCSGTASGCRGRAC